ncbi:MAG: NADH-quinone oxidoreductase subunit J [Gammaproteobacteria bacterium]|nr:NADH-quinone oxidoreductase subunit J [Gammaproteobacteria bacterium]MDH5594583.1 NADH-quinone oxidoreductase subunit J [Gammaproteobacteria bacterium]MDH5613676.1 NADH-quinone oxidoreductase subunit J [Gammaproteobacteria bacterium]
MYELIGLSGPQIVFYIFSSMLVISALMVITVRNPVRAALFLVLAFFSASAIWLLLEAEFLAITLVLVYVGAVMVLFLFVVMMLDINMVPLQEGFTRYLPLGLAIAVIIVFELSLVLGPENFGLEKFAAPAAHTADYSNTKAIGSILYTDYVYPFEVAAVILLVAIIAAIALTFRRRVGTKTQKPEEQVAVRREDRVRLVKMKAEKR